jgi:HEAT repeat protein
VSLYERRDVDRLAEAIRVLVPTAGHARPIAARAFLQLRAAGSSRKLAEALVHRDDDLPLDAADASLLVELVRTEQQPEAPEDVVATLISALADARSIVAERAEALLTALGGLSTRALVQELADGAAPHRAAAVLREIKDPVALEPLVAALSHPDARVRSQSCLALGDFGDPATVEPLLHATRDPEHTVRVHAGAALDSLGTAAIAVSVAALPAGRDRPHHRRVDPAARRCLRRTPLISSYSDQR